MYRIMCKESYYYIYLKYLPKIFINNKNYLVTYFAEKSQANAS